MSCLDGDIGGLAFGAAQRLVDQDLGIGQRKTFALGAACQKESAHAGRHAYTDGGHVAFHEVHGIIDRHAGRNRAAGAVDIELDILIGIFALKEKHLSYDQLRGGVSDLVAQENDPFL